MGQEAGPWAVFAAVTARWLLLDASYKVTIDGLNSRYEAGSFATVELSKIYDPVKNTPEDLRLLKPTGFTSKWADLGKTTIFRISTRNSLTSTTASPVHFPSSNTPRPERDAAE